MSGYNGWSMSNRAIAAYAMGKKPLSKWTKTVILKELEEMGVKNLEELKRLTKVELQSILDWSEWHHTSNYYNETDFYEIDLNKVLELDVENIIKNRVRKPKEKKEIVKPTYIIAYVTYEEWEGSRNHPKKVYKEEIVRYMSDDKMVTCNKSNSYKKRLNSLSVICQIEQKTKFATEERLMKKVKKVKKVKKSEK